MQQNNEYSKIFTEINKLFNLIQQTDAAKVIPDWIPRKDVMTFLDYRDTQMSTLLNNEDLVVATIGKRKFIKRDSLLKLLERYSNK